MKGHSLYHRHETFRNGKRHEDKAYHLLPLIRMGGETFFKKIVGWKKFMGVCFIWALMIRSCNRGGKVSQMHFPII